MNKELVWGNLIHLSYNMWEDHLHREQLERSYRPYLRFSEALWNEILEQMAASGMNMVVLDLGDGVLYDSHPEIAVENAWSTARLRQELDKLRSLGLEPIPKLNFATTHDAWLGPYSRCVSTETYYNVCRDLIKEVAEIFQQPRFFHLGMDEEGIECQRYYEYVVIRQHDLWWRDLYFYIDQVEQAGCRAWVWSDAHWHKGQEFLDKMPPSVLQSNWYYGSNFQARETAVKTYLDLDQHGFDQIPTGSNWSTPDNFGQTVEFCQQHLHSDRLLGFLQTSWKPTLDAHRSLHTAAIVQAAHAIAGAQ